MKKWYKVLNPCKERFETLIFPLFWLIFNHRANRKHGPNRSKEDPMRQQIAKLFMKGRNQAVYLPEGFRFEGDEVLIRKKGDEIILSSPPDSWDEFFKETPLPSDDFMTSRNQG